MKMSRGLFAFIRAFTVNWLTLMSGAASVPFAAAAVFSSATLAQAIFVAMAILLATFAVYRVWHAEWARANALQATLDDARMLSAREFLDEAIKRNWNVEDGASYDILRLQNGLREAGLNMSIQIYGRVKHTLTALTDDGPRELIPALYWKHGNMGLMPAMAAMGSKTADTNASNFGNPPILYKDLHFGGGVIRWLDTTAEDWRNRTVMGTHESSGRT